MRFLRSFSHVLVVGLFLTFSAIPGNSNTPLTMKIEKIGDGATAHSNLIELLLTVSGGNSQNSPTCEAFFKTNNVEFSILAEGQNLQNVRLDTKWTINSKSLIETVSLSPAMLKCRIKIQPYSDYYLLYSWEFTKDKVSAVFNLESTGVALDSKPFTLTNYNSLQPSISILEPQRGAKVQGEFYLTTSQSNSEFWNLASSSVIVMTGLQSVCQTPSGMTEVRIGKLGTEYMGSIYDYPKPKNFLVSQVADGKFRFRFFNAQIYTICIAQTFVDKSNAQWTRKVTALVGVDVISKISELTYSVNDIIFQEARIIPYEVLFDCPNQLNTTQPNYTCSLMAKVNLTRDNLFALFSTTDVDITLTGKVEVLVCESDSHRLPLYRSCNENMQSQYRNSYILEVGFEEPRKFKVTNYLSSLGYTSVEADAGGAKITPSHISAWELPSYRKNLEKAANAPPNVAYQKQLVKVIRASMVQNCQKLPSNFSRSSVLYTKKITSRDLVPGYLFRVGSLITVSIYEMGNTYLIGPSSALSDEKKWRSFGCGSAIRVLR